PLLTTPPFFIKTKMANTTGSLIMKKKGIYLYQLRNMSIHCQHFRFIMIRVFLVQQRQIW
ncbi:MAG: hypothetical protein WAU17_00415, partial [Nitrospirales bacterium]